ncbi:MAG: cupin domain-containing protein, partial [Candidatus Kuenenia sp.]|nr:cupin domain-containing protein [Candidatus Kuenenia sp.]
MAYIKRKAFSLSLLFLLFVGIGCTTVKYYPSNFVESLKHPTKFPDIFDFSVQNIEDIVEKNPLQEGEDVKITDVGENRNSSMHVFQLRENTEFSSHYHKRHDEVIYVKKGNAIAILDGTRYLVKPGSILQIPSKTVHKFVNTGDEAFMAISLFSPPFDGRDQKFIQKEKRTDRGVKEEKRLAGVTAKKIKEEVEGSSEEGTEEEIIEETETVATAEESMKEKAALPLSDDRDFQTKKEVTASDDYLTLKERGKKQVKKSGSVESREVDIVSLHEKLTHLLKLKEEGIISADEYEKKKDAL